MTLLKELLTEAQTLDNAPIAIYCASIDVYDTVEDVLSLFGYKNVASLDAYMTAEEIEDEFGTTPDEDVGVWAKSKPSKNVMLASIKKFGIRTFG